MSKEKQIEEMTCKKCLHYKGCLKRFKQAKKNGQYEFIDEEEYFAHADECDFFITGYRKQIEGEWERFNGERFICSACAKVFGLGSTATLNDVKRVWHYCPHCGAKMKGGAGF